MGAPRFATLRHRRAGEGGDAERHRGAVDDERGRGEHGDALAAGERLLREDQHGDQRHDADVHDAQREQDGEEEPAAAQAVHRVLGAHADRARFVDDFDPKTSVLNKWSQAHEVNNLFVSDAAPFNGNPDKNVTLTIVANAWRAAEHLADEMKKGNI